MTTSFTQQGYDSEIFDNAIANIRILLRGTYLMRAKAGEPNCAVYSILICYPVVVLTVFWIPIIYRYPYLSF